MTYVCNHIYEAPSLMTYVCNHIYEALSLMTYVCNYIYEALSLMKHMCGTGQECLALSIMKYILCTQVKNECISTVEVQNPSQALHFEPPVRDGAKRSFNTAASEHGSM